MLAYMILAGYLILSVVFLNKGTKRAQIADANTTKNFGIALISTVILYVLMLAKIGLLYGYPLAYLAVLPMVKVVYKTTWDTAYRAWIVGFIIWLALNAVGFFLVLTTL